MSSMASLRTTILASRLSHFHIFNTHFGFHLLIWSNMSTPIFAFVFLAATLSLICVQGQEHFLLYLRWPGGLCSKGECCFPSSSPLQDEFLIEFLARTNGTGSVPECSTTRFFYNALQPLLGDLKKYWPSLTCPSDIGFRDWENMWDSNGVCTGLSQVDYFTRALTLRSRANLLSILSNKGIKPSMEASYSLADVENAINEGLGVQSSALVHCGSTQNSIVRNVRLCVDPTATNFINCPQQRTSVCASTVKFLPIPQLIESVAETSSDDEL